MEDTPNLPAWVASSVLLLFVAGLGVWGGILRRWVAGSPALEWSRRRRVPWGLEGILLPLLMTSVPLMSTLSGEVRGAAERDGVEAVQSDDGANDGADGGAGTIAGKSITPMAAAGATLTYVCLAAFAIAFLQRTSSADAADFGFPKRAPRVVTDIGLGLAACLGAMPLVYGVQNLVVMGLGLESAHPILEALSVATPLQLASAGWLAVVAAPAMEEFAYRALLQGWFERYAGREALWPMVASAFCFAIAHQGQGYAPIALFVFGLVVGYVYQRTHRLLPCVIMHAAFNAFSFSLAVMMSGA